MFILLQIFVMPFKVIQTIENGQLKLTAVPDQWEHNNILFWPKKAAEKLRRQENSPPSISWDTMPCHVKRTNLRTFQEAVDEIDAMSDRSETETDQEGYQQTGRKKDNLLAAKSFNDEAKTLVNSDQEQLVSATSTAQTQQNLSTTQYENCTAVSQEINYNIIPEINIPQVPLPETGLPNVHLDQDSVVLLNSDSLQQLQLDLKSVKEEINTVMLNQNSLYEIQNNMAAKLAEIHHDITSFIQISSKNKENAEVDLIKSLQEFEELENNLENKTYREGLIQKLGVVCTKGSEVFGPP
ncbi:unnamed protein product [Chilo suppressalis]|uniref:Uncharacterized protein n=1 Tax=Chilo suppressalis TaxID=168631 RepID=A0ABN8BHR3_CHISP|nr:unnamed protein product [Chilo suppressalis]